MNLTRRSFLGGLLATAAMVPFAGTLGPELVERSGIHPVPSYTFATDGTKMWIVSLDQKLAVHQYALSRPWDVMSAGPPMLI